MKTEKDRMNAAVIGKRVNIGEEWIQELSSKPRSLRFVKVKAFDQMFLGGFENSNPHETRRRISSLAASQSLNCSSPLSARRWHSLNTS